MFEVRGLLNLGIFNKGSELQAQVTPLCFELRELLVRSLRRPSLPVGLEAVRDTRLQRSTNG